MEHICSQWLDDDDDKSFLALYLGHSKREKKNIVASFNRPPVNCSHGKCGVCMCLCVNAGVYTMCEYYFKLPHLYLNHSQLYNPRGLNHHPLFTHSTPKMGMRFSTDSFIYDVAPFSSTATSPLYTWQRAPSVLLTSFGSSSLLSPSQTSEVSSSVHAFSVRCGKYEAFEKVSFVASRFHLNKSPNKVVYKYIHEYAQSVFYK